MIIDSFETELTEAEKEKNRELSAKRIRVEHGVRKVKIFKILRQDYRLGTSFYPKIAETVVGLISVFANCDVKNFKRRSVSAC